MHPPTRPHTHAQVPDATGRCTLIMDLGRLSFASAPHLGKDRPLEPSGRGSIGAGLLSLSVWPDERQSAAAPSIPKLSVEEAAVYEVRVFAQAHFCK